MLAYLAVAWFLLILVVGPLLGRVLGRASRPDRSDDRFYGES
jgi:hypothetical protein